ncbi:unannotated protein [freshwater metagenome]|uniref:Unannotated protein n=1 Tax=freshwater metagenome TaxID=449393 RepID=A0A6J6I3F1_9ZZZZ|nr:TIGR03619 family F420-dependent LLM class oxidoreductase [Actinomycetota bacterium]MSZ41387.1 TIGR03619 family F420-dependent LLM class oxidoreductase [Actinomycetota bacterium]
MKFGVSRVPTGKGASDPDYVAQLGAIAEARGCESLWMVEHVVVPASYNSVYPFDSSGRMGLTGNDDLPDPIVWMSYLAASTSKIKLATGVVILPIRNPVVLAKQMATLDRLSNGRIILGLGLGWLSEEFDAVGVPFARRGARADEYLEAMTALWSQSPATFKGEFVNFENMYCTPQPESQSIPLVIGGISEAAVRRAVRFGAGMHLMRSSADEVRKVKQRIADECERTGKNPSDIEITMVAPASVEQLQELNDIGVDRVFLSVWDGDLNAFSDRIEDYQANVLSGLSA